MMVENICSVSVSSFVTPSELCAVGCVRQETQLLCESQPRYVKSSTSEGRSD